MKMFSQVDTFKNIVSLCHNVVPAIHFAQNNVAKDKRYFGESSYFISAKLTEYLLTIAILWQKMMTKIC